MRKPAQLLTEEKSTFPDAPILIIDKRGITGGPLALRFSKDTLVVFVSEKKPTQDLSSPQGSSNIIHIPYAKKFPTVPDNTYSYMFIVNDYTYLGESIPTLLKKAERDKSSFILITYLRGKKEEVIQALEYKKTKIILYGDIFGENLPTLEELPVNSFVYQAQKLGKIQIPGDGTEKLYPVFIDDFIEGILKAAFSGNSKSQIFYLFQKHPLTYLSLSSILKKNDPSIKMDFLREKVEKKDHFFWIEGGEYLLEDNYSIEEKIKNLNLKNGFMENREIEKDSLDFPERKQPRHLLLFLFLFMFFLLLPILSTLTLSLLGAKTLNDANSALDKGNLEKAREEAVLSKTFFSRASDTSKVLIEQARFIGLDRQISPSLEKIEVGKKISFAASDLIEAFVVFKKILTENPVDSKKDFEKFQANIKDSAVLLEEIKNNENIPSSVMEKIQKENILIGFVMNMQDKFSDILGMADKKTYMILFQNNMELRPGGGFIGSYGMMSMDKGKITDFSIHDVYDADGQLKGHVEPPYPIRRYLPKEHWYLRDSNFDVDFTRSASSSAFFLNAETGQMVDGVIGVDVSFVKNLLSAIGPIYISQYNETVNPDNLFNLAETHAEKDFFPSSRQKKDFLSFLFKAIQEKLSLEKNLPYLAIAKSISESLAEKHIVFAFSNPALQNISTVSGWSSSLRDDRKITSSSINDFIGINEANLGVNKVNYFIGRSLSYNLKIGDDGSLLSKLTISYRNTSTSGVFPGGDYKNYLRLILPSGVRISTISIDGVLQKIGEAVTDPLVYEKKNFIPPQVLEVEKTEEQGKTIYGFLTVVPVGSSKTIVAEYQLPKKDLRENPLISYNLKFFKQPGTDSYPFNFSFSYPSSYRTISSSKEIKNLNGVSSFSQSLSSDQNIFVNLAKK
ncbi:MAG: DUF4012 domain-containing protein [Patescibacteria group bacterium]|nr:DUF4012 domain-containing protein [Patescibacteria group bacterium]